MGDGSGTQRTALVTAIVIGAVVFIGLIVTLVLNLPTLDASNVKQVGGVSPAHGNVGVVGAQGITVVSDPALSTLTIRADGVQRVSGLAPGIAVSGPHDFPVVENTGVNNISASVGIAVGGTALSPEIQNTGLINASAVAPGMVIDFDTNGPQFPIFINTGLLNVSAGEGIELDVAGPASPQAPVVVHSLTRAMRVLPVGDAASPVVRYGFSAAGIAENTWVRPVFTAVAGDGGVGDVAGTAWAAPTDGFYMVSATCHVTLNFPAYNNRVGITLALSLNAASDDPTSGIVPAGGMIRSDISHFDVNAFTAAPTTLAPTEAPTTGAPTASPTAPGATLSPTSSPTGAPTASPTESPTGAPTLSPTESPTSSPTAPAATLAPTEAPTLAPTESPTEAPTEAPTLSPTGAPTGPPTAAPTPALEDHPLSVTGTFQVCPTCAVVVGAPLWVHVRLDNMGPSPDTLAMDVQCSFQTARVV